MFRKINLVLKSFQARITECTSICTSVPPLTLLLSFLPRNVFPSSWKIYINHVSLLLELRNFSNYQLASDNKIFKENGEPGRSKGSGANMDRKLTKNVIPQKRFTRFAPR